MNPEREAVIAIAAVIYAGRCASGNTPTVAESVRDAIDIIDEVDKQLAAIEQPTS